MRKTILLALALVSAFAVQALAEEGASQDDEARRSKVFATVGPETITVGELEDIAAARSPHARMRLEDPEALRQMAEAQVENELFYQGALELGYEDDPEVQRFVNQTLVKLFVRKDFEEAVTPDDVPEEQVKKYYEDNPEEFRRPEMRRARHILVASKEEALEILELLRTDETQKFRALAKRKSLDTETNVRGGDLLYFTADGKVVGRDTAGTIDRALAKAAFSLDKTGDLSQPIDLGDDKWSILELTGIRPERVQTLEQASQGIRRRLWREEREGALDALITRLRTELEPEVYPERVEPIVIEPAPTSSTP